MHSCLVVLDTNVVLDWLVFDNADCRGLTERLQSGRWRWLASEGMQQELKAVLQYPAVQRWNPDPERIWHHWSTLTHMVPEASRSPLRCTDADDQQFIDVALEQGASWLLSRDRALLKLARRARAWRLEIAPPGRAQAGATPGGNLAATTAEISLR